MNTIPTGTVTFLFTDIEGSTELWERYPQSMQAALARHDAIVRAAIAANGGQVFNTAGDAFCAAFPTAPDALAAALAAQRALNEVQWGETPIRVRMGLHTGSVRGPAEDLTTTPTLNRVARVMSLAHGGQVLLTHVTGELVRQQLPAGVSLREMGLYRLKGIESAEPILQVVAAGLRSEFPPLKSGASIPNNLPLQLTSFIGREREIAEAKRALAETRLLTLTGSGGVGKTRLSLQVAAEVLDAFPDGVWFVALAPLSDPALVAPAIVDALKLNEATRAPATDVLSDYLRDKQLLLVLDNFEQLMGAAPLVKTLLVNAPKVSMLISSRTLLRIAGEREFAVPLLGLPDPHALPPLAQLTQYEAMRLFIERARTVKSDFAVNEDNAPAMAEICYRLDGLPLALELAAARVRLLPPQKMLAQLSHKLRFLVSAARDLPARQQTLRGAIDWSFDLLAPEEQALFRRLAVFAGGATLEGIEAVCGAELDAQVFGAVESLLDKSLLKQVEHDGEARYTMLEMIREYALEKLSASGELETLRDRHLEYFLGLTAEGGPALSSLGHLASLEGLGLAVLKGEDDNLGAALTWGLARNPDLALRLAGALGGYWMVRGHLTEGRRWLKECLARIAAAPAADAQAQRARQEARAIALAEAGTLSTVQGDVRSARPLLEESMGLWRSLGDQQRLAMSLTILGLTAFFLDDIPVARAVLDESIALGRAQNNRSDLALALTFFGCVVYRDAGDYAAARVYFEEAIQMGHELGIPEREADIWNNWGQTAYLAGEYAEARRCFQASASKYSGLESGQFRNISRSGLADVAWRMGEYAQAEALYRESLVEWNRLGNRGAVARNMECLAFVAQARCQVAAPQSGAVPENAAVPESGAVPQSSAALDNSAALLRRAGLLLGAADALRAASGNPMTGAEREEYDRELSGVRMAIGATAFDALFAEGRQLTAPQAISLALRDFA